MPPKESDFQRIACQAREFREQEEQRIAAEKEEEARRIKEKKEAEREKIAQAHEKYLENQQEESSGEGDVAPSSSFDNMPSPGTVKLRAEWLRKLEKDATARRVLEEQFNTLLATRRKNNPNEALSESEAAVKAVLSSPTSSGDSNSLQSLHSAVEESTEPSIAQKLHHAESKLEGDVNKEFEEIETILTEDKEDTITIETKHMSHEMIDDKSTTHSTEDKTHVTPTSDLVKPEPTNLPEEKQNTQSPKPQLQLNTNNGTKQEEPKEVFHDNALEYGVEVNSRTQAMLLEDDLIPIRNNAEDRMSLKSDFVNDENKKKIVIENSIPVARKVLRPGKGSSKTNFDEDDDPSSDIVHKKAFFELPVEVAKDGLILSPDSAELSMITTIPPSRLGGRVSGCLEGRSSLGNKSNNASGSASLAYKVSKHSRLTLGIIRGCEPHHPLITIGGRLLRHGSSIGVTFYHNAKFLHQMILEHSLWSLSFRHCYPKSKWIISSELSRKRDLSLSLKNGDKLCSSIGWNLLKPEQIRARVDICPRITDYRKAHLYCQWKASPTSGIWNFGLSLIQNLHSQVATIGLGWRLFSTRGLEWVLSWSRGNATIQIPIVVSKGLATNSTIGHSLYFSIISYVIQEYIAEMWGWIGNDEDGDGQDIDNDRLLETRIKTLTKARRDATLQKDLMSRQALRKMKDEKEKDGLIIKKAVYKIENGEEWDVTIPLQFWVTRSTLFLIAGPKSELLGFYDISASQKNISKTSSALDAKKVQIWPLGRLITSWNSMWYDLLGWTPTNKLLGKTQDLPTPKLSVWYEFRGKSSQITINDREELRLPAL